MAEQSILREYFVALGFKTDEVAKKKFNQGLVGLDKDAIKLGKSVLGAAAAIQVMVGVWATQMERLYYISKRSNSTVANIQGLAYGAEQIGISGETIKGALVGMAAAMRSNPGLQPLLESLGVKVTGRDMSDVMTDFVGQLRKMPPFIAERFANMFGIDRDTLFMMSAGLEQLRKAQEMRKQMAADVGLNPDEAAKAAKEYANSLREVGERLGILKDVYMVQNLKYFQDFTTALNSNIESMTKWISKAGSLGGAIYDLVHPEKATTAPEKPKNFMEWATRPLPGMEQGVKFERKGRTVPEILADAARSAIPDSWRRAEHRNQAHTGVNVIPASPALPPAAPTAPKGAYETPGALFERLEQQYALPPGLLYKVWSAESGRGNPKFMRSHAGAKGHFGFMDDTAAQYGVKDPNDLTDSATGSAKMWAERIKARGGDLRTAAADYNWGQGKVDRYGLGRAPAETRDYMDKIAGPAITQTNNTTINGVSDPNKAAQLAADQQQTNNADLVRNMKAKVQ